MHSCLSLMVNRQLSAAWGSWASMAAKRAEALQLVRRSVILMCRGQSVAALAQWRRRARDMSSMRRAASRLLSMQLARALESWSLMATARADALELVRRSVSCAVSPKLAAWLLCWRDAAVACANMMAQNATMDHAVRRLLNMQLSAAWGSWTSKIATRAEALQLMRRGVAFIMRRELACGFSSWRAAVQACHEHDEQTMHLRQAVGRMLHGQTAAAWTQWASWSGERTRAL